MIEADIVMGVVVSQPPTPPPTESTTAKVEANQAADNGATNSDTNKPDASKPNEDKPDKVPIMAHPPAEQSDLSLVEFVATVAEHNAVTKHVKGIKLDFKSIEAVEASMPLIKSADVRTLKLMISNLSFLFVNVGLILLDFFFKLFR